MDEVYLPTLDIILKVFTISSNLLAVPFFSLLLDSVAQIGFVGDKRPSLLHKVSLLELLFLRPALVSLDILWHRCWSIHLKVDTVPCNSFVYTWILHKDPYWGSKTHWWWITVANLLLQCAWMHTRWLHCGISMSNLDTFIDMLFHWLFL